MTDGNHEEPGGPTSQKVVTREPWGSGLGERNRRGPLFQGWGDDLTLSPYGSSYFTDSFDLQIDEKLESWLGRQRSGFSEGEGFDGTVVQVSDIPQATTSR